MFEEKSILDRTIPTLFLKTVTSTNDEAKRLAKNGLEPPFAVVADRQTSGKGSKGKFWHSENNGGLYFSLLLKPSQFDITLIDHYHQLTGKVVQNIIMSYTKLGSQLKWPNDVLIQEKKVAGILIETVWTSGKNSPNYIVVGVGLNLNQISFPEEIKSLAISLKQITGTTYNKKIFSDALTEALNHEFTRN